MGIFNSNTLTPAQQAAQQIISIAFSQYTQLAQSGLRAWSLLWANHNATPADILAALGTNAASIFALATLNINTVDSAAAIGGTTPPTIPGVPSPYNVVLHGDGSATVTITTGTGTGT